MPLSETFRLLHLDKRKAIDHFVRDRRTLIVPVLASANIVTHIDMYIYPRFQHLERSMRDTIVKLFCLPSSKLLQPPANELRLNLQFVQPRKSRIDRGQQFVSSFSSSQFNRLCRVFCHLHLLICEWAARVNRWSHWVSFSIKARDVANSKRRDANVLFSSNSGEFEVRLMVPSGEDVSVHDSRDVVGGWLAELSGAIVWMEMLLWGIFLLPDAHSNHEHSCHLMWWVVVHYAPSHASRTTTHNILSHLPNLISLSTKR